MAKKIISLKLTDFIGQITTIIINIVVAKQGFINNLLRFNIEILPLTNLQKIENSYYRRCRV